jgi:hypothetical protein
VYHIGALDLGCGLPEISTHGGLDDERMWVYGLPSSFSLGAGDALLISSLAIVSEGARSGRRKGVLQG